MKVGFTGTRDGWTCKQDASFRRMFCELIGVTEFHQGCCDGSDELATVLVESNTNGNTSCIIIGHPPEDERYLSKVALGLCDETYDPAPYLVRDRRIVDKTDKLIATPKGPEEQRSGTWYTVRYARKQGKQITIIWPDGHVTVENSQ